MSTFQEQALLAIQSAGGRLTSQRRLLINLLEHSPAQLDAEQLYHLAQQQDTQVSLTTVYRTLNTLQNAGLVRERYLSQEHERKFFEIHPLEATDYLFTCRQCKTVIPFQTDLLKTLQVELESKLGIQVSNVCICFSGLCPSCLIEEKNQK